MRYRYKIKFKIKNARNQEVSGCWESDTPITDLTNFDLLQEIAKNLCEDLSEIILPEHLEITEASLEYDRGEKKRPGNLSNYSFKPLP